MDSANSSRRGPRRLTINLSFSIGSKEGLDDGVNVLLSQCYGAAEGGQEEKKDRKVITSGGLSIEDSLALIKASPIGTTITVNYDHVERSEGSELAEQGYHKPAYYEEVVETKTADTGTSKIRRAGSTRRMSIDMATRRMSIDMSIESTDDLDSELEDILLKLYEASECDQESTGEISVEEIIPGFTHMGLRRDSLSLVKCKAFRRKSSRNKSFADVAEESEEEPAENFVVGTKKG